MTAEVPPDGTASMQRDVMQGRPSELEAQVGAVQRMIYEALLPLERKAREKPALTA